MIDLTLVIQGINFFVAYLLLRRFFLRPIVAVMQQETSGQQALQRTIETRKRMASNKQQELIDHWKTFQQSFRDDLPTVYEVELSLIRGIKPPLEYKMPSTTQVQELTRMIVQASERKVKHVHW